MSDLLSYLPTWQEILQQVKDGAPSFRTVIESNFTTSLVGSLAGAFGGAWAAQRIAERSRARDEMFGDIRQTNAASSMIYGVANAHLGLKRQFIKDLKEKYDEEQKTFALYAAALQAGKVPPQQGYYLNADFQTIKPLLSPTDEIRELLFKKISIAGPTLLLAPVLLASIQSLNDSINARNALAEEWHSLSPPNIAELYLGLPYAGVVDQRYKMLVEAIYKQTDDVIAFSAMIGEDLYGRAVELRKELRKKFRIQGPLVSAVDLSRFQEVMPPDSEYENFRTMYKDWKISRPAKIPRLKRLFRNKAPTPQPETGSQG